MSKTRDEIKFDEARMDRLALYANHDLLRTPYTDKYTNEEVEEAKRRYDIIKQSETPPSLIASFFSLFSAAPKPINKKPKKPEPNSGCRIS